MIQYYSDLRDLIRLSEDLGIADHDKISPTLPVTTIGPWIEELNEARSLFLEWVSLRYADLAALMRRLTNGSIEESRKLRDEQWDLVPRITDCVNKLYILGSYGGWDMYYC